MVTADPHDTQTDISNSDSKISDSLDSDKKENKKTKFDNRHLTRQVAIQLLYRWHFIQDYNKKKELASEEPGKFAEHEFDGESHLNFEEISNKLEKKIRKSLSKIEENIEKLNSPDLLKEIDGKITKHAPEWPIDQINPVNLQILRYAIFEGFYEKSVPPKIAIDEAIELTKDFCTETDVKFISGVLGNYYSKEN